MAVDVLARRKELRRHKRVLKPPSKRQIDREVAWTPRVNLGVRPERPRGDARAILRDVDAFVDVVKSIGPVASRAFEREFSPFARRVVDSWPVETGLSRAAWRVRLRRGATTLRFRLVNTVFYSRFLPQAAAVVGTDADRVARDVATAIARGLGD